MEHELEHVEQQHLTKLFYITCLNLPESELQSEARKYGSLSMYVSSYVSLSPRPPTSSEG